MKPQIITPEIGYHNSDLARTQERLLRERAYRDLSTVIICPTRGHIPCRVLSSWFGLMRPPNQKIVGPIFAVGMEVGAAYSEQVEMCLAHPELKNWKYVCVIEEDNIVPPDGLLKLYESIEAKELGGPYDAVSGLYYTKGPGGVSQIWGDIYDVPLNFRPQVPQLDKVMRCCGIGMGFGLFRMSMLADPAIQRPLFKTQMEYTPGQGAACTTQDLWFCTNAGKLGYKFAVDCRVKVGHFDEAADMVW